MTTVTSIAEKRFETQVKKFLTENGIYPTGTPKNGMKTPQQGWFFKVWGGGYQTSGIPDLLACINGLFVAVELKASKGKPSKLQKLNLARINQAGGIGILLYPEGLEDFKLLVKEVLKCKCHTAVLNASKNAHTSTNCVI